MKAIIATSEEQLRECAIMYMSQNDMEFFPIDREKCIQSIISHWKEGSFIRVLVDNNALVGFIMATSGTSKHNYGRHLTQEYYCSNQKGYKAAKAVIVAHEALLAYAKTLPFEFVLSSCSHMDPTFVFSRILEKRGWMRRGYMAIYRLQKQECKGWMNAAKAKAQ